MPVKRTRLDRAQEARYLESAQEIQVAGICEIPNEWSERSLGLDIFAAPPQDNILGELSTGITACAIGVEILARKSNLILKKFSIVTEWGSELNPVYRNAGGWYGVGAAVDFTNSEVLNHRIENGLHFRRCGDEAEGWVVASGQQPIPDKYRQWMITDLRLVFTDQFGHDHSAQAKATLQRSARLRNFDVKVRK